MITAINKDNASKYTALFAKATKALRDKGDIKNEWSITDLESYFSVIEELMTIDKKYTILPTDEKYFMIDANSRTITVPSEFKKNGLGVQGDEVAEIIYFKIDRYFDFMDLNNAEIYIQWEQAGNMANPANGVSIPWVRDIESDPDYLIFGWPLDSNITALAGPIKFSVRFIQWNEDKKIVYSFSTLDAMATINPALDFESNELIVTEEVNDMIKNRIKNTVISGGSVADMPIYTLALAADTETNLEENGKYIFKVQAYSPDAGVLTYSWKVISLDGTSTRELDGNYLYEKIEDKSSPIELNKVYYAKSIAENGDISYSIITVTEGDTIIEDLGVEEVYEKYAILEATGTGKYYAIATNRVNASVEKNISGPVTIPAPGPSVFEPNGGSKIMNIDNNYTVKLEPIVTNSTTNTLTYQWLKNNLPIENATNAYYEVKGDGVTAALQGNYALKVTAKLNNDDSVTTSANFNVTYPAAKPIVSNSTNNNIVTVGNSITVDVTYESNQDYHMGNNTLSYQWYYATIEGNIKEAINGATNATYTTNAVDAAKVLVCKVTNTYNGTIAEGFSHSISVVNAE